MMKKQLMKITTYFVFFVMIMGAVTIDTNAYESKKKLETANSNASSSVDNNSTSKKIYSPKDQILEGTYKDFCNIEFDDKVAKMGANKDYSAVIVDELRAINNLYASCVVGGSGNTKKCYFPGQKNVDRNKACPYDLNGITWTFPNVIDVDIQQTCMQFRYESYRKLSQAYCPANTNDETVKNIKQQCENCEANNWYENMGGTYSEQNTLCQNIKSSCNVYLETKNDPTTKEECYNSCGVNINCRKECDDKFALSEEYEKKEYEDWKKTNIVIGKLSCESISSITQFVGRIYKIGMVFLIVGLIVLTMLDYGKAVMSSEQDIMKKANKHLVTRIIILVIFLLLPMLINLSIRLFLSGKYPDIKSCLNF